jgi:hypothetical protein
MPNIITDSVPLEDPALVEQPLTDEIVDYTKEQDERTFDFTVARTFLNSLIGEWAGEVKNTEENRKTRDIDIDVQALRASKKLAEDETVIPDRVIDSNIQRELPPYINYLKNSRRLAIFTCMSNPERQTNRVELEFTRGMTYSGWETPHYKCLDGSCTHGWDAIEVVFDAAKPLHCSLEHIGHEKLIFPQKMGGLQSAQMILRAYDLTLLELKRFVDAFGFDREQVGRIITAYNSGQKNQDTVRVYKRFCKHNGVVYVSWFCMEHGVNDWLKAPSKLFLGIKKKVTISVPMPPTPDPMGSGMMIEQPPMEQTEWKDADIDQYPVFLLPYRETEKPYIVDYKGRVFYDEYKQEGNTAILSGFVNGLFRATQIFASQEENGTGSSLKELQGITLSGGKILSNKVNFWSSPYPDPMILKALQHFDLKNSQETNQPTFAAMNREDSRKTAREMSLASEQQTMLNSVQLTLFSTFVRSVYSLCWLIAQSQALQGNIKFLLVKQEIPAVNPMTGGPLEGVPPQVSWVNDEETIAEIYDIRAAGDVDVIQRAEKIQQMKQDWPVISNTVLAPLFLAEMLRLQYPDSGEKWAKILEQQTPQLEQAKGVASGLAAILQGALQTNPELLQSVSPEEAQQMQQMMQQGLALGQPVVPGG